MKTKELKEHIHRFDTFGFRCVDCGKINLQNIREKMKTEEEIMAEEEALDRRKKSRKGVNGKMKILVACEESQEVCKAFRELGHEAFSCDILPCSGGYPDWHIQDDVLKHLEDGWDLMIAHPPCTFLSKAGTRWLFPKHKLNQERYEKGIKGKEFFLKLLNAPIERICVENPVPHKVFNMPKETQIIHPYQFGHPIQKATLLWLKNLPKLEPTKILKPEFMRDKKGWRHSKWFMDCGFNAGKEKSKTFTGIAKAMANQWNIDKLVGEKLLK